MQFKNIIFIFIALSIWLPQSTLAMQGKKQTPTQIQQQYKRLLNEGLFRAILAGNTDFVNLAINHGANVNCKESNNKTTPLHAAALGNNIDIVKILIARDANINAKNIAGQIPLHNACIKGNTDIIKLLITNTTVNAHDDQGWTPLHTASQFGHLDAMKLLLAAGANKNTKDSAGGTPLYIACQYNHPDIVEFLCNSGTDTNIATTDNGTTPLQIACTQGNLKIAEILIVHKANIDAHDLLGWTPLHSACARNHPNLVSLLIINKANIEAQNEQQMTPLLLAAGNGFLDITELLITDNANVNAEDETKWTPLHYAVSNNYPEIVEILLKHGANMTAEDDMGITPVHLAYYKQNQTAMHLFVKYGAHLISDEEAKEEERQFFAQLNQEEPETVTTSITANENVIQPEQPIIIEPQPTIQNEPEDRSIKSRSKTHKPQPAQLSPLIPKAEEKKYEKGSTIKTEQPKSKNIASKKASSSSNISNGYQVLQDKKFKWGKFLSKQQQGAIKDRLKQLKNWPLSEDPDIKPLKGEKKGTYRMRVGGCRIIFFVDEKNHQIFILEIGLRKNIYKKANLDIEINPSKK
jgi:uncharacterized protein